MNNLVQKPAILTDEECQSCGEKIPAVFAFLVERGEAFCRICGLKNENMIQSFENKMKEDQTADNERRFKARIEKCNLPESIIKALDIRLKNQDVRLEGKLGTSLEKYLDCGSGGVRGALVLSGDNGVGKSVAAGFLAYRSNGAFLARSEWMRLNAFGENGKDLDAVIAEPGIIALDEVLAQTKAGDSDASVRIVNTIACERHDKGRGTVITTRANKEMFAEAYGNDIIDRTRQYVDRCGSGWLGIKGKSRR